MAQSRPRKMPDVVLHVTKQNVKDGIANDQSNCTFGQCSVSKEYGIDYYVDPDPLNATIHAKWRTYEKLRGDDHARAYRHYARVVRRREDGTDSPGDAIAVVAATDLAKRTLLKRFPEGGIEFVLTDHVMRPISELPEETPAEREKRLAPMRSRVAELRKARAEGKAPPPKPRKKRVSARFGTTR